MSPVQPLVLIRIDWRIGGTMRLCNGGFVIWDSATWLSEDATYGSIIATESLNEGTGDQVPAFQLALKPKGTVPIPTLAQPGNAKSRVRVWLGESDPESGLVIGTPDLEFDGLVERMAVRRARGSRTMVIDCAAKTIRALDLYAGNAMSASFHKRVWPGETGEDRRTGLGLPVAWGASGPPRGSVSGSGGERSFWGFGGNQINQAVQQV